MPMGLGFIPKPNLLLHQMHNFSLTNVFNYIKTTSPINKKSDLVKLNQLGEGLKGKKN